MSAAQLPDQPLSVTNQARLFQRLRARLLRNSARALFRHSPLRLATILASSLLVCSFVFAISFGGFYFLVEQRIVLHGGIVGVVFDLLFLALAGMLVFSSGIILYSSLFASPESAFLLAGPARDDQVFAYKFQGAVGFSSWAFLLLGFPLLLAYGIVFRAAWHYYLLAPVFFFGFVLLPGSVGALGCLLVVNFVPRRRKQVLAVAALAVAAGLGVGLYRMAAEAEGATWDRDFAHRMLSRFDFAREPLLPSHWMSRGLQAAARGDLARAGYFLGLVWSNGLVLYVLTAWAAGRLYRRGCNRVATGGTLRRRYGGHWLDAALSGLLGFLDPQLRLLIVKDFRTFRRDPAQWAQVAIFTGLLTLYATNLHRIFPGDIGWTYRHALSALNLVAVALLLCTYTGRFIFPMLSLEGRKFWVLGLLPLQRDRLLWGKFVFSATGGLLIAEFLVLLSDVMLEMPWEAAGLHALTVAVLAVGLSGLSVGLGACWPNFKEGDPSKIAVGFGGTLNLVAGFLFLLVTVCLMTVPWHVVSVLGGDELGAGRPALWLAGDAALAAVLGAAATVLPLRAGAAALRRREF